MNRDPSGTDERLADYQKLRAEGKGKGKAVAATSGSPLAGKSAAPETRRQSHRSNTLHAAEISDQSPDRQIMIRYPLERTGRLIEAVST